MADDLFLRISGIKGESPDAKHKGDIDIESFSWGIHNTASEGGSGGGGGAGKSTFDGVTFVARSSAASPPLFLATATGKRMKEAQLTVRRMAKDAAEYIKITFSNVIVSSYQQSDTVHGDRPTDLFSLRFSKLEFGYSAQRPDGSLEPPIVAGWDEKTGSKF